MVQVRRRTRTATAILAIVCAASAIPLVGSPPASAQPARGAAPAAPAAAPDAGAIAAEPTNSRWAHQILRRLKDPQGLGEVPKADRVSLGSALGHTGDVRTPIRAVALKAPQVQARVGELFVQLLERPADPSGLAFWSGRIVSGRLSYENLVVTLTISNEAYTKAGGTPEGYVDWVFEHVLGRPADPSGAAYWEARLESGTSRDRFARSFLRSPERARALVRAGFLRYLGRAVDSGGLTHWTNQYTAAKVGELDLAVALLASNESRGDGCGYDPKYCLLPFPSSRQALQDDSTLTGERIALKPEWMPANTSGTHINPVEWNRNDGFSPGQALVVRVPGIDLAQTGLAPITDIEASLSEDAPVAIIDTATWERQPYFAELDANAAPGSADQVLYIRPATNWKAGHRYLVGMQGMKDAAGATLPAPAAFDRERDLLMADEPWPDPEYQVETTFRLQSLNTHAGMATQDLYLSWEFRVASTDNTTGRMLHVRDDALATLGDDAPDFTVDTVTPNPRAGVAKRIEGTYEVPLYLTGTGAPGAGFNTGSNGLPVQNGTYVAKYDCEIPTTAEADPARATVYGHGLFGSLGEVRSGPQAAMVVGHNMAYCATDTIGMAGPDVANAITIIQDLSTFGTLPDRTQQGILNTVFLGRLLSDEDGFVSDAAFQDSGGGPLIDTANLFYDGNSQGAVVGGAYLAVDPTIEAGVLGVAGMNYSTLLERSVDFDPFNDLLKAIYPNRVDQVINLQVLQMLWDRGETNGYVANLNSTNNLPGTPGKRVLVHVALGDHQVSTLTAEVEARTAGMAVHRPAYADDRSPDVEEAWNIPALSYPSTGSALIIWDSGAALSPLTNIPPRTGEDPHSDPRNSPDAQAQKSAFLQLGGTITNVCGATHCTAPS